MKNSILLEKELPGCVLDIGGGGEGIIGRLYGSNVNSRIKKRWISNHMGCCN
jgi:hypothetical protein